MGKSITDLSSVTTVGLDLAKHLFQVHGVDASGRVVVAKAIRRNKLLEFFASLPPCLVGLEASGSAHHWARELTKLGHEARMMPPAALSRELNLAARRLEVPAQVQAAVAARHVWNASVRRVRSVRRDVRWRWTLKVFWTAA
jgi:transposase